MVLYPLVLMILLSGCAKVSSSQVLPDLANYNGAVQELAAFEMAQLPPPCPRDAVIPTCSAMKRMLMDYGDMRNQTRAIMNNR